MFLVAGGTLVPALVQVKVPPSNTGGSVVVAVVCSLLHSVHLQPSPGQCLHHLRVRHHGDDHQDHRLCLLLDHNLLPALHPAVQAEELVLS